MKFVTSEQDGGKLLNTITDISTYYEGSYKGFGIYLPATGKVWAPVNCGYDATNYKCGKLYQWGRYVGGGCPGYDAGGTYQGHTGGVHDYSDGAPVADHFYQGCTADNATARYDWYTPWAHNQFPKWPMKPGDTGYIKGSIDNPCPSGWRVPDDTELASLYGNNTGVSSGWDNSNYGYWFDGTATPSIGSGIFLPAAGYRHPHGDCPARNVWCWYWSSVVYGTNAKFLQFASSFLQIASQVRTFGGTVRCIQE